jgi:hypothetical protein
MTNKQIMEEYAESKGIARGAFDQWWEANEAKGWVSNERTMAGYWKPWLKSFARDYAKRGMAA